MNTTTKTQNAHVAVNQKPLEKGIDRWFSSQAIKFEEARFGWMTAFMTIQSCLAAIACMFILQNKASDVMLAACAALAMGCNAVLIAQAPGKWCLFSFYLSIVLNTIFILLNI